MTDKYPLQKLFEAMEEGVSEYSGRGMMGRTCIAVTTDTRGNLIRRLGRFLYQRASGELLEEDVQAAIVALQGWTEDSMGRGIVIYFPNVPFVGAADV